MLLQNLEREIKIWIDNGEQLIIAGDFNDDVRTRPIQSMFEKYNLVDLILRHHGQFAPNTYSRGTCPIDGIFGTMGIDIQFGGYTAGTWGLLSDHRALWIDINTETLFGGFSAPLWKPKMRRLKLEDPKIVENFNKLRLKHLGTTQATTIQKEMEAALLENNQYIKRSRNININSKTSNNNQFMD